MPWQKARLKASCRRRSSSGTRRPISNADHNSRRWRNHCQPRAHRRSGNSHRTPLSQRRPLRPSHRHRRHRSRRHRQHQQQRQCRRDLLCHPHLRRRRTHIHQRRIRRIRCRHPCRRPRPPRHSPARPPRCRRCPCGRLGAWRCRRSRRGRRSRRWPRHRLARPRTLPHFMQMQPLRERRQWRRRWRPTSTRWRALCAARCLTQSSRAVRRATRSRQRRRATAALRWAC